MAPAPDALPLARVGSVPARRLLDQLRERVRYLHCSIRTEEAYVLGVRAFVRFNGLRHPKEMGADEVCTFLSWLAVERRVIVMRDGKAGKDRVLTHMIEVNGGAVRSPLDALQAA